MEPVQITPIGTVRTNVTEIDQNWRKTVSEIHLRDELVPGLTGLENWSHIVVIFAMHKTAFNLETDLVTRPNNRDDMPETGVFAQRSQVTPNTIGVTVVKLNDIKDNVLTVQGLDALDGTPVLSIKPYAPIYDGATEPLIPVWFLRLMSGRG